MNSLKKIDWNAFTILAVAMCLWMFSNAWTALSLSAEWRLVHDAPILHYTASMIFKGHLPYRDIIEINLPFTYWLHMLAIAVLGNGDLPFRQFDQIWMFLTGGAIVWLCWRKNPWLSVTAACGYMVIHVSDGPASMAQRDFLMTPFLVAGAAAAMEANRRREYQWAWWLGAGTLIGCAAAIKPIALLLAALIIGFFAYPERKDWRKWVLPSVYVGAGLALPLAASLIWLLANGIFDDFLEVITKLVAAIYVPVEIKDWLQKSAALTTSIIMLMFVTHCGRDEQTKAQYAVIQAGLVYALLHYVLQRKGFWYNLYPALAFGGAALCYGLKGLYDRLIFEGRLVVAAAMFSACVYGSQVGLLAPEGLRGDLWLRPFFNQLDTEYANAQRAVIEDFPEKETPGAQWKVHFFDYTHCALWNYAYHKHWEPTSRFLHPYPFYLHTPVMKEWRKEMLADFTANPPDIMFVCKQSWPLEDGTVYKVIDGKDGNTDISGFFATTYRQVYQNGMYRIYARKKPEDQTPVEAIKNKGKKKAKNAKRSRRHAR